MIDNLIIDKSLLTRYEEKVSELQLALRSSSVKPNAAIDALKEFFEEYFKECYQKNVLDAQNFYFSKQATKQFIEIVRQNIADTLSDEDYEKYVEKALKKVDLDKYLLSKKSVDKIKKDMSSYFKSILDILDFNFGNKPRQGSSNNARDSETKKSKLIKNAENYVRKNVVSPKVNLNFITGFLKENVFSNFSRILKKQSLVFNKSSLTLINSKKTGFKTVFTKLWVPPLKTLSRSFRRFENNITFGIARRVRKAFKRMGRKLYNVLDTFFPFTFLGGLFKISKFVVGTGLKLIKGALHLGISVTSKALHYAFAGIKFVTGLTLKIGVGAMKIMTKTLSKIGAFKMFKLTSKILFGFLKSYPGAFLLGYVVGTIYKNFGKIIDFANDLFEKAKTAFDEHVYKPFILPAIEWFNGTAFSFYIDEIRRIIFDDNGENKLTRIVSELRLVNKNTGRPLLVYGKTVEQNIYELEEWLDNAIDNITFGNLIEHVIAPIGGAMIGGAVGAKFGALAGAAIGGPIGAAIGGAVGYLAGSFGGEWLGQKLGELFNDKGGFKGAPKRTDSGIEYTARSLLGETNVVKDVFYDVRKSDRIKSIISFGRRVENFEINFDAPKEGEPDRLQEYIDAGVLTAEEVSRIRSSPEATASFQEQAIMLRNLGRLTYDRIFKEVKSVYLRIASLVNDKQHKGFFTSDMLFDNDFYTDLTLDGAILKFNEENGFNPLFFKIFRAMSLQDIIQDLALKRISLSEFFNEYKQINTPRGLIAFSEEKGNKIRIVFKNEPAQDITDFIYPKFFKNNNETQRFTDLLFAGHDDPHYVFRMLPKEVQLEIVKDQIRRFLAPGENLESEAEITLNDILANPESYINIDLLKHYAVEYFKNNNKLLFLTNATQHVGFFGTYYNEKDYDMSSILMHSGAFSSLRNVDAEYEVLTTAVGGLDNLKTLYDTSIKALPYLTDAQRRNLSMGRVLSRVAVWNEDAIKSGELTGSDLNDRLRHDIEFAVQSELKELGVSTTLNREVLEAIGSRLENIQTLTSSDEILSDAEAISAFESKADLAGISELLSQYHELIKANIDFSNERLIPVIRRLAEKGIGRDRLEQVFGHEMLMVAFPEGSSGNAEDSSSGDVSPAVNQ